MADRIPVCVGVNGTTYTRDVEPRDLLVYFLREDLGLSGTHVGCDTSQCGACTVLLNGQPVKSCTLFAVQADGKNAATTPIRANGVEQALQAGASPAEAARRAGQGLDPTSDLRGSAEYKMHLAEVLTQRALEAAS